MNDRCEWKRSQMVFALRALRHTPWRTGYWSRATERGCRVRCVNTPACGREGSLLGELSDGRTDEPFDECLVGAADVLATLRRRLGQETADLLDVRKSFTDWLDMP